MSRLSNLFRSKAIINNTVALRAGGGIPRPDVPLLTRYEHKRHLSVYDLNIWWYDNSMPEYLVTLQDSHLHDHIGTLKAWGNLLPWLVASYLLGGAYFYIAQESRVQGRSIDFDQSHILKRVKKFQRERLGTKRHFLNLNNTGESGVFHFIADSKPFVAQRIENWGKMDTTKKQMLTEAKNSIIRIENEIRAKHAHHHHNDNHHQNVHTDSNEHHKEDAH